jgi:hypothetical protein
VQCGPCPELVATYRRAWTRRKEGPGRNGTPSRKYRKGPAGTPNRSFESARGHRIRRGRRWRGRPPPRTAPPPRGTPGTRPRAAPARRRTARTGARGITAAAACRAGPPCTPRTRPAPPTPRRRPGPAARRIAAQGSSSASTCAYRPPPSCARAAGAGAAAPLLQRAPLHRAGCAMDRAAVAPCPSAFSFLMREPRPVFHRTPSRSFAERHSLEHICPVPAHLSHFTDIASLCNHISSPYYGSRHPSLSSIPVPRPAPPRLPSWRRAPPPTPCGVTSGRRPAESHTGRQSRPFARGACPARER